MIIHVTIHVSYVIHVYLLPVSLKIVMTLFWQQRSFNDHTNATFRRTDLHFENSSLRPLRIRVTCFGTRLMPEYGGSLLATRWK